MHLALHHRRLRRVATSFGLAALLAGLTLTVTQCRQVGDSITGVGLFKPGPVQTCIQGCSKTFNDASKAESDIHQANIKACNNDAACLAAEETRFEARKVQLNAEMDACKANCHHQGGGSGS